MTDAPSGEMVAAAGALARTFADTWNEKTALPTERLTGRMRS